MPQFDQNIIEKFGREKLPTGWPWRFFTISVILLGISLVIYLGLTFGYRGFLNNQLGKKDQEINQLAASIPKEDQAKIFSRLFRAKNAKEKLTEGTGLGLYIVQLAVEKLGGKVWFESIENGGTTFYVSIPLKGIKKISGLKLKV